MKFLRFILRISRIDQLRPAVSFQWRGSGWPEDWGGPGSGMRWEKVKAEIRAEFRSGRSVPGRQTH